MAVRWNRGSYHHHVPSEGVGQVSNGGVSVSIRGLALGAVSWLVASESKIQRVTQRENDKDFFL